MSFSQLSWQIRPDFPSRPLCCGQLTIHPAFYSPRNEYEIPFHLYRANHMLQIHSFQDHWRQYDGLTLQVIITPQRVSVATWHWRSGRDLHLGISISYEYMVIQEWWNNIRADMNKEICLHQMTFVYNSEIKLFNRSALPSVHCVVMKVFEDTTKLKAPLSGAVGGILNHKCHWKMNHDNDDNNNNKPDVTN